jgi:hypothetical protein
MTEDGMDELIVRAANLIGAGADEGDVRTMLLVETGDEGLAFLLLQAGRLLAAVKVGPALDARPGCVAAALPHGLQAKTT